MTPIPGTATVKAAAETHPKSAISRISLQAQEQNLINILIVPKDNASIEDAVNSSELPPKLKSKIFDILNSLNPSEYSKQLFPSANRPDFIAGSISIVQKNDKSFEVQVFPQNSASSYQFKPRRAYLLGEYMEETERAAGKKEVTKIEEVPLRQNANDDLDSIAKRAKQAAKIEKLITINKGVIKIPGSIANLSEEDLKDLLSMPVINPLDYTESVAKYFDFEDLTSKNKHLQKQFSLANLVEALKKSDDYRSVILADRLGMLNEVLEEGSSANAEFKGILSKIKQISLREMGDVEFLYAYEKFVDKMSAHNFVEWLDSPRTKKIFGELKHSWKRQGIEVVEKGDLFTHTLILSTNEDIYANLDSLVSSKTALRITKELNQVYQLIGYKDLYLKPGYESALTVADEFLRKGENWEDVDSNPARIKEILVELQRVKAVLPKLKKLTDFEVVNEADLRDVILCIFREEELPQNELDIMNGSRIETDPKISVLEKLLSEPKHIEMMKCLKNAGKFARHATESRETEEHGRSSILVSSVNILSQLAAIKDSDKIIYSLQSASPAFFNKLSLHQTLSVVQYLDKNDYLLNDLKREKSGDLLDFVAAKVDFQDVVNGSTAFESLDLTKDNFGKLIGLKDLGGVDLIKRYLNLGFSRIDQDFLDNPLLVVGLYEGLKATYPKLILDCPNLISVDGTIRPEGAAKKINEIREIAFSTEFTFIYNTIAGLSPNSNCSLAGMLQMSFKQAWKDINYNQQKITDVSEVFQKMLVHLDKRGKPYSVDAEAIAKFIDFDEKAEVFKQPEGVKYLGLFTGGENSSSAYSPLTQLMMFLEGNEYKDFAAFDAAFNELKSHSMPDGTAMYLTHKGNLSERNINSLLNFLSVKTRTRDEEELSEIRHKLRKSYYPSGNPE